MPLLNLPQEAQVLGGRNSGAVMDNMIAQMAADRRQKQAQEDAVKMAMINAVLQGKGTFGEGEDIGTILQRKGMPDLSKYQAYPEQPTTSISVTPYSFGERLEAQNILGMDPRDLAGDPDLKGYAQRTGGWFGGWGPGSQYEYTPGFEKIREEAQQVLSGPGKVTTRQTGKFTGRPVLEKSLASGAQPSRPASVFAGQSVEDAQIIAGDDETKTVDELIQEYQTTNNPQRLAELEEILQSRGVEFE